MACLSSGSGSRESQFEVQVRQPRLGPGRPAQCLFN